MGMAAHPEAVLALCNPTSSKRSYRSEAEDPKNPAYGGQHAPVGVVCLQGLSQAMQHLCRQQQPPAASAPAAAAAAPAF